MRGWEEVDLCIQDPVEDSPDFERDINVVINWRPGYPAKTSGDPDECYPAEGPEFEILEAKYDDGRAVPNRVLEQLDHDYILELIERKLS